MPQGGPPPYVLTNHSAAVTTEPPKAAKKRRRDQMDIPKDDTIEVKTYQLPNMGPYPIDKPRQNKIRFTPAQGER